MIIKKFNDDGELVVFREIPHNDPFAVDHRRLVAAMCGNTTYYYINNIIMSRELLYIMYRVLGSSTN